MIRSGYVTTPDGIQLHWQSVGEGPVIACCNGVGVSIFFWKYFVEHFRDRHTLLLWDYRGHGRSGRRLSPETANMSIERHADDLAIVLDAACPDENAIVAGHSMGCQVSLEFRRRYPSRCLGLVLILGTAGKALETFFDYNGSPRIFKLLHRASLRIGPKLNHFIRPLIESPLAPIVANRLSLVDPYYMHPEDLDLYLQHMSTLDFRLFLTAVQQLQNHDAWDLLPDLNRPLLVIAAERDAFTPMWCSKKISTLVPDAEFMVLADATHAALVEQPETINHRVDRFIRERICAPTPS